MPVPEQYVSIVCVCFNRFLYFSTAPVLLARLFGAAGPSAVYPVVFAFAGVVNLANFAWTYLSKSTLGGSFLLFNVLLNLVCVAASLLVFRDIGRWGGRASRDSELLHVPHE